MLRRALLGVLVSTGTAAATPWGHVTVKDRCHVVLDAAPKAEVDAFRTVAENRFGAAARVRMTKLGDRVLEVRDPASTKPATAPRSAADFAAIGQAFMTANADLFGIQAELASVTWSADKMTKMWLVAGTVHRTTAGMDRQSEAVVEIDDQGRVAWALVGTGIMPELSLCAKPTLAATDAKLLSEVIGKSLDYTDWHGPQTAGKVSKEDVDNIEVETVQLDDDGLELARGYAVTVTKKQLSWKFFVDGETGKLLGAMQLFHF